MAERVTYGILGEPPGRYRYIFLKKDKHRNYKEKDPLEEMVSMNWKIARLEFIKEKFHQMYEDKTVNEAELLLAEAYEWRLLAPQICSQLAVSKRDWILEPTKRGKNPSLDSF